ncbi:MAG: hypothetical protein K2F99_04850 [Muribaculaceae bacterium]|nr:hypothetical protein [Muribaculaceae bacterium]
MDLTVEGKIAALAKQVASCAAGYAYRLLQSSGLAPSAISALYDMYEPKVTFDRAGTSNTDDMGRSLAKVIVLYKPKVTDLKRGPGARLMLMLGNVYRMGMEDASAAIETSVGRDIQSFVLELMQLGIYNYRDFMKDKAVVKTEDTTPPEPDTDTENAPESSDEIQVPDDLFWDPAKDIKEGIKEGTEEQE